MSDNTKYNQPKLTTEDVLAKLTNASPLQASRVLIDMELHDQRSSIDILEEIYKDFEAKEDVIDELVTPMGLSLLDSIITHKDLKLNRTGLTASRVWHEIKGFEYSKVAIATSSLSSKLQLEGLRETDPNKRGNVQAHKLTKHKENSTNSDGAIINEIDGDRLLRADEADSTLNAVNTDHLESADAYHRKFANNIFLTDKDMKIIVNHDDNLASISESQNKSKGAGSFSEINQKKIELEKRFKSGTASPKDRKKLDEINEKFSEGSLQEGIKLENKASKENLKKSQQAAVNNALNNKVEVLGKAGKQAAEQAGFQAIGHAVILFIKPLFYELNDAIKFGIDKGVGMGSTMEGLQFRFKRIAEYIKTEIIPTLVQGVKDLVSNFLKVLIEGILGLVTGLFKSLMRIVSEGFSALVGAFKILRKSEEEMSSAQKADAILKLFASTVVTFVVFYFESTIMSAIPNNFIKDIALALLSGVASTIVIYILDKADIFSTKAELRTKRVKDIFEMRIQQVKENTDAFEGASIEKLAKDRLQFRAISERMTNAIDNDDNVNSSISDLADFMHIDLKIKSTDDFMHLLSKQKTLVVN
ncbi:hypothetical protein L2755_07085 [Shewanella abyssi]|uniref:hypothetical protein n=1 Tax=Shewanella abyssi TaxID=311789 RepID=UPI00200CAF56|nr:hypothetical protein [Shewanella abyssi]MCL1049386.1 hypothetical protein [Shewanella abyssi]